VLIYLIFGIKSPVNDSVYDPVKSKILQHLKQNPNANYAELADKQLILRNNEKTYSRT